VFSELKLQLDIFCCGNASASPEFQNVRYSRQCEWASTPHSHDHLVFGTPLRGTVVANRLQWLLNLQGASLDFSGRGGIGSPTRANKMPVSYEHKILKMLHEYNCRQFLHVGFQSSHISTGALFFGPRCGIPSHRPSLWPPVNTFLETPLRICTIFFRFVVSLDRVVEDNFILAGVVVVVAYNDSSVRRKLLTAADPSEIAWVDGRENERRNSIFCRSVGRSVYDLDEGSVLHQGDTL